MNRETLSQILGALEETLRELNKEISKEGLHMGLLPGRNGVDAVRDDRADTVEQHGDVGLRVDSLGPQRDRWGEHKLPARKAGQVRRVVQRNGR